MSTRPTTQGPIPKSNRNDTNPLPKRIAREDWQPNEVGPSSRHALPFVAVKPVPRPRTMNGFKGFLPTTSSKGKNKGASATRYQHDTQSAQPYWSYSNHVTSSPRHDYYSEMHHDKRRKLSLAVPATSANSIPLSTPRVPPSHSIPTHTPQRRWNSATNTSTAQSSAHLHTLNPDLSKLPTHTTTIAAAEHRSHSHNLTNRKSSSPVPSPKASPSPTPDMEQLGLSSFSDRQKSTPQPTSQHSPSSTQIVKRENSPSPTFAASTESLPPLRLALPRYPAKRKHIKRERSESPAFVTDVDASEPDPYPGDHGTKFYPLPLICRKSAPNWKMNRERWKLSIVKQAEEHGIAIVKTMIRSDGMALDWKSLLRLSPSPLPVGGLDTIAGTPVAPVKLEDSRDSPDIPLSAMGRNRIASDPLPISESLGSSEPRNESSARPNAVQANFLSKTFVEEVHQWRAPHNTSNRSRKQTKNSFSPSIRQPSLPSSVISQASSDGQFDAQEVALTFLQRFTKLFDTDRAVLAYAYTAESTFSYQLAGIPVGVHLPDHCSQPSAFASITGARNLALASHRWRGEEGLHCGRTSIMRALLGMGSYQHVQRTPLAFEVVALRHIPGVESNSSLLVVTCHGELEPPDDLHSATSLRFDRSFILKKNPKYIERELWPWVILSEQLTLRPYL